MNLVTKYTRASKFTGKLIVCPCCDTSSRVYHFAWSALGCQWCKTTIEKTQWRLPN